MSEKECITCGQTMALELFKSAYGSRSKDGYTNQCMACRKVADKEYKARINAEGGTPYDQLRRKMVEDVKEQNPCFRCGYSVYCGLDFHHIDPATKSFIVGNYLEHRPDELAEEIMKCVLLCKNCHAEFHKGLWALSWADIAVQRLIVVRDGDTWVPESIFEAVTGDNCCNDAYVA